jgi:hypothetical protein
VTCRPDHPARHPDFEPGNELAMKYGGYSEKRIGERARIVAKEVLELAPHLSAPEFSLAVSSYAMSRARVELLSAAIEAAVAQVGAVKLGARIIEAATGASREEAQQRASLGLDPRSLAELRAISSTADLNVALLHQIAPELPRAIGHALEALGQGDRAQEFTQHFVAALRAAEQEDQ